MIDGTDAPDSCQEQDRAWVALTAAIVGSLSTAIGLMLLLAAWMNGSSAADFALELGIAVALSGIIWLCSLSIRGEKITGKFDVSALAVLLAVGACSVTFALVSGKLAREALLTSGAAVFTLWTFCSLEKWYVLKEHQFSVVCA